MNISVFFVKHQGTHLGSVVLGAGESKSLQILFCHSYSALICYESYQAVISLLRRHIAFCFLSVTVCGFFVIMMRLSQEGGQGCDTDEFRSPS